MYCFLCLYEWKKVKFYSVSENGSEKLTGHAASLIRVQKPHTTSCFKSKYKNLLPYSTFQHVD